MKRTYKVSIGDGNNLLVVNCGPNSDGVVERHFDAYHRENGELYFRWYTEYRDVEGKKTTSRMDEMVYIPADASDKIIDYFSALKREKQDAPVKAKSRLSSFFKRT